MYVLRVVARFEAAHHLTSYKGRPEPNHGHSWRVEAVLAAAELDGEGMAFDFVEVKTALQELAARLDHGDVNTVPPFDAVSVTGLPRRKAPICASGTITRARSGLIAVMRKSGVVSSMRSPRRT